MEEAEILSTVAQLAIGVAGFSGIAIVFKREPGPLTELEAYRIAILFANAFAAMFIALLPFPLYRLFDSAETIWRVSSGAVALFSSSFLTYFVLRTRRFLRQAPEIFGTFPLLLARGGHALNLVIQAGNAAGLFGSRHSPVFLFGVLWLLFHSTYQFGRILFVQPPHSADRHREPAALK